MALALATPVGRMFQQAFKNIDDVLWKEAGCGSELDYTEQASWLLFLKYLDDLENDRATEAALDGKTYTYILDKPYRWESWAAPKDKDGNLDHHKALTGDDLVDFVDRKLFPYLHGFRERATNPHTIEYKIGEIFGEIKNKIRSGYNLREVIDHIDELRFRSQTEKHELSALYEEKIKRMGNAGRNGGEYYTPRPLIRAMIKVVDPKVGERIYDGACGSAGFLCEAYDYMRSKPGLTLDEYIYTTDDTVVEGEIEAGRRYEEADFNRLIEIKEREKKRVEIFMSEIEQREKTLVFCANQAHALAVRDLINQAKKSSDPNYCHRVTANDGAIGEQHLRDFQDNEKTIPTILTTSQKLSTGVDARNIRNIVLMRSINSMIEFKQIIGRGTRLYEGKDYFTIYDFVKAHHHFADKEWDGEPVEPEERSVGERSSERPEPEPRPSGEDDPSDTTKQVKTKVKLADGKERLIQHMTATTFWHPDGTPMSAAQFMEALFGKLPEFFKDEDELRALWSEPDTRRKLLTGLAENGFGKEQLDEMRRVISAEKSDIFDVLAFVAYASAPLTREERAERARLEISTHFNTKQQTFLDFVLSHYVRVGVEELEKEKLGQLLRLQYRGSISDAVADLGSPEAIGTMFVGFQKWLYDVAESNRTHSA